MWKKLWIALLALGLQLALAQTTLTVLTHNSWSLDKNLMAQFEQASGLRLRFLKGGDAGEMLNKAILSRLRQHPALAGPAGRYPVALSLARAGQRAPRTAP